jgi:aminoglycoside 3-N-acetyltransferase
MVSFRDIVSGLRQLIPDRRRPVIVHISLSTFGGVRGGVETLLGALLMTIDPLMMPTFTYKTMIIPEDGPADNGVTYGSGGDLNQMAEFFTPAMPADKLMGITAETFRRQPYTRRSTHPILSFAGVNVSEALHAQTSNDPLAPIRVLNEQDGWVLLLGVNHTVNTSIHYAEKVAGRKQFVRWALTPEGMCACPGFPGCSDGFDKAGPELAAISRVTQIGNASCASLPIQAMVEIIANLIHKDPQALLCDRPDCERCNTFRQTVDAPG